MGKRLILILALAFVVGITCAAYAEVQNVKVSGDILMEGVSRDKLTLRKTDSSAAGANQFGARISTLLTHMRVRVDADLTDNVSTTVRLLNERTWNTEDDTTGTAPAETSNTAVNIDLAYVTLKEFLYSPLSVTVGRQELHYGNDLIIGDIDTNNFSAGHGIAGAGNFLPRSLDDLSLRKSFDAIKAVLNYDPLVVDLVYARISKNVDNTVTIGTGDGVNLYGVNANYALDKSTTLEAYYWLKRRNKIGSAGNNVIGDPDTGQAAHSDTVNTIGGRVNYSGIKDLTLGLEAAYQFGNKVNSTALYVDDISNSGGYKKRRAYAIQFMSKYNLTDLANRVSSKAGSLSPMIGFNYTLLSGENWKSNKKAYHGWDGMYENQAGGTLFNKIVAFSNCQLFNVNTSMKLVSDMKLSLDWYYLRLMKAYDSTRGAITAVHLSGLTGDPTYNMESGKNSLGNEFDANLTYDYTEDVQFGLNMGWFVPGNAFAKDNANGNRKTANQVIGSMKVTF